MYNALSGLGNLKHPPTQGSAALHPGLRVLRRSATKDAVPAPNRSERPQLVSLSRACDDCY